MRIGFRGDSLAERCYSFDLHIANHEDGPNAWTFCSSLGVEKRLDYIIHNANIVLKGNYPTEQLDLGSDHRAVHASFYMGNRQTKRKTKKTKPIDLDRYHAALDEHIRRKCFTTIRDIEKLLLEAVCEVDQENHGRPPEQPVWQQHVFQNLIAARKACSNTAERMASSKRIREFYAINFVQNGTGKLQILWHIFRFF